MQFNYITKIYGRPILHFVSTLINSSIQLSNLYVPIEMDSRLELARRTANSTQILMVLLEVSAHYLPPIVPLLQSFISHLQSQIYLIFCCFVQLALTSQREQAKAEVFPSLLHLRLSVNPCLSSLSQNLIINFSVLPIISYLGRVQILLCCIRLP